MPTVEVATRLGACLNQETNKMNLLITLALPNCGIGKGDDGGDEIQLSVSTQGPAQHLGWYLHKQFAARWDVHLPCLRLLCTSSVRGLCCSALDIHQCALI